MALKYGRLLVKFRVQAMIFYACKTSSLTTEIESVLRIMLTAWLLPWETRACSHRFSELVTKLNSTLRLQQQRLVWGGPSLYWAVQCGVVNPLDFCPASLKSLGCFYFRCVLSSQWKAVTVNLRILRCEF